MMFTRLPWSALTPEEMAFATTGPPMNRSLNIEPRPPYAFAGIPPIPQPRLWFLFHVYGRSYEEAKEVAERFAAGSWLDEIGWPK